jgi:hypothetical protein
MTTEWALHRLQELRSEYAGGDTRLLELDRHRAQLHDSMLRVAGAIQVLEELIAASGTFAPKSTDASVAAT